MRCSICGSRKVKYVFGRLWIPYRIRRRPRWWLRHRLWKRFRCIIYCECEKCAEED